MFRTITGVIVLYAMLLQAFLVSATPAALAHRTAESCSPRDATGGPGEEPHGRLHQACCVLAHVADLLAPAPAASIRPLPAIDATAAPWRPAFASSPAKAPDPAHPTRGPPLT